MRAFRLAYDGSPYHGFQRQPDVPTVEGALFDALERLDVYDSEAPKPSGYSAAGRTDADVSALAQTVAFGCPPWCTPSALNAELPDAVRAWASTEVPDGFHAIREAGRREYVYHLHAPAVDDDALFAAASRLAGEHDFGHLTPDDDGTVREIEIDADREGEYLAVTVTAGGFPRQLVRRLVTLLDDVGRGERDLEAIDRVLGSAPLPGHEGVPPAPASPLVLRDVEYDLSFAVDHDALEDALDVFSTRRIDHASRARVAETVLDGLAADQNR